MFDGTCDHCGFSVLIVQVAKSGKYIFLDPGSRPDGSYYLDHRGRAVPLNNELRLIGELRGYYMPHVATCPATRPPDNVVNLHDRRATR